MRMDEVFRALREAVTEAQAGSDGQLNFRETSEMVGPVLIRQLVVSYTSGNEHLSLLKMHASLSRIGKLSHFEYRGRGSKEVPSLTAVLMVDGQRYDLI